MININITVENKTTNHKTAVAAMAAMNKELRKWKSGSVAVEIAFNGHIIDANHLAGLCRFEKTGKKDFSLKHHEKLSGVVA